MTNLAQRPSLYLDMDGVLADFNLAAQQILGAAPEDSLPAAERGRWPEEQWQRLRAYSDFYLHLPKTPRADSLVQLAVKFTEDLDCDLRILTAIPSGNDMPRAFYDKVCWVQRAWPDLEIPVYFGPYSRDKHRLCRSQDDILIDDRTSNCADWRAAGGTAIQVRPENPEQAELELQEIYHTRMMLQLI